MKRPKRIRIVASFPERGQDGIDLLIGEEYDVICFSPHLVLVKVESYPFGGIISLNPDEYEVIT